MKHLYRSIRWAVGGLVLLTPVVAAAQTAERRTSIGITANALQYQGRFGSDFWKWDQNQYAPGLVINQYLGRGLDINTQLFYAELKGRSAPTRFFATTLVNANASLKLKLNNGWALKENAVVQPYLLAGTGLAYVSRTGQADTVRVDNQQSFLDLHAGAGISLRLGPVVSLFVQSSQHRPRHARFDGLPNPAGRADQLWQHAAGLTFSLGQAPDADEDGVPDREDKCPGTLAYVSVDERGCPPDADQDGVPDFQDQCPDQAGNFSLGGCPDADDDTVPDAEDACPNEAGSIALQGCPDTDQDGVPDKDDLCLDTPAGAAVDAKGCTVGTATTTTPPTAPANDPDNDGVTGAADRCPASPGPAANRGCPELKAEARTLLREATRRIGFELNRATLLPSSYAVLDSLAQLLRRYPDYSLSIAGHTDSRGPAAYNLRLSRERAAAARQYLIAQGVSAARVEGRGYAARHPLASNATDAGRARNRRVEFDLFLTGDPNAAQVKYGPEPTAAAAAPARKKASKKPTARKARTKAQKRPVPGKGKKAGRRPPGQSSRHDQPKW
ncbi:OmpA family protein [Hymenobacter weizhouensis]|uniref:OmpA family protein n=1 Tax=Hymenobacter sp. YIM 151500-1 TaxID=2987689 RepID=UPI0022276D16|nr:OmpA family protein [Hymenobacter sp. YIM 151500-1]UYZ63391.1 OmpA family protein [Hymenobacter sp. YIM 151500-1]